MMEQRTMPSLVDQIRGVSYKPTDLHDSLNVDSIMLLRANNIDDGKINFDDVIYVDRKCVSKFQLLRKGDILICASSGSRNLVGKAAQLDFDGEYTFGAFCKVVRPRLKSDAGYIGMFFQSPIYRRAIAEKAQGININNIRGEHIDSLAVSWPDQIDRERAEKTYQVLRGCIGLRQRQLRALDTLIKARFVEMFGDETNPYNWPIINVEDIATVTVGVVIKPAQYYTDADHGVKAFRSLNIGEMYIKDNDWVYFTQEGNDKNNKSQLHENDLLIIRSGAPGVACIVTKQYEGCNAIDIIIARPNTDKIDPYYLCMYTNMPHGKRQIEEGTGGAAQQHFNVGKYNKLRLMLPPIEKQKQFSDFIAQIDKSKLSIQQGLKKLEILKKALMQQYFG